MKVIRNRSCRPVTITLSAADQIYIGPGPYAYPSAHLSLYFRILFDLCFYVLNSFPVVQVSARTPVVYALRRSDTQTFIRSGDQALRRLCAPEGKSPTFLLSGRRLTFVERLSGGNSSRSKYRSASDPK